MTDPDGVISYPGRTSEMAEKPRDEMREYVGRNLLNGKCALITGGDSGSDARSRWRSQRRVPMSRSPTSKKTTTRRTRPHLSNKPGDAACGCLATSQTRNSVRRSSGAPVKHWDVDSFFRVTKAALRHIPDGGTISNTGSINGLRGNTSYSRDHGC